MKSRFIGEIFKIHIPIIVTTDDNDLHAGHDSAGGIGSVSRRGNQAYISMALSLALEVGPYTKESGVFAL